MQQQGQWGAPPAQWGQPVQGPPPPAPPPKKKVPFLMIGCLVLSCPLSCIVLAGLAELGEKGRIAREQAATPAVGAAPAAIAPTAAPSAPAAPPPTVEPAQRERLSAALDAARAALAADDYDGAQQALAGVQDLAGSLRRAGNAEPDVVPLLEGLDALEAQVGAVGASSDYAASARDAVAAADALTGSDPEAADAKYEEALESIAALDELPSSVRRDLEYPSRTVVERKRMRIARAVREAIANRPITIRRLQEMQVRYADLRGGPPVQIIGTVRADTYYNCRYSSQGRWRSFRFSQGMLSFEQMHVYCPRGEANCEALHERAIRGNVNVAATLRYPPSNSVCAESQAEIVGYTVR